MSYALHIWEKPSDQPWPATVQDADKLLNALRATKRVQNPKFIALAKKLTRRYPCITSSKAEAMPEWELAWTDGPLDGRTDSAVYGVGVALARWEEVQPFVIEQARTLGLNVTDDLSGEIFLADGRTLRPSQAGKPAPAGTNNYDHVPRPGKLEPMVFERLTPLMQQHGFKALKGQREFKCKFPNGWHLVCIFFQDDWPLYCEVKLTVISRFHAVTDLTGPIVMPDRSKQEIKNWDTTILGQHRWMDDADTSGFVKGINKEYRIKSYAELDAVMEHLSGKLETRLFPILERYKTIEGLDALLNPDPVSSSIFLSSYENGANHIGTAFLANNPRLEALCALFLDKTKDGKNYPDLVAGLRKCVEYVRSQRQAAGV